MITGTTRAKANTRQAGHFHPKCLTRAGLSATCFAHMGEFGIVLGAVIPVFIVAVIGFVVRKLGWLAREADASLLRLTINVLFPCLILDAVVGNPALLKLTNLLLPPLVGFGTVALGFAIAALCRPLHGLKSAGEQGTFALAVGLYNYGYVPLPLALLLFGEQTTGVLFVHNLGVELAMWTLGVLILNRRHGRDLKRLLNAPLITIAVAVGLNALGFGTVMPQSLKATLHWLGQCAIPLSLLLIGAVIADHLRQFHSSQSWRVIGTAVFLRICLLPLLFLLLAKYLPASMELKRVIVLQAAMPSAVFPIVMSRLYEGDPPTALRVVIGTSVVALLTIPLWIQAGIWFVGL